jgi:hypothetical protein
MQERPPMSFPMKMRNTVIPASNSTVFILFSIDALLREFSLYGQMSPPKGELKI